MYVTPLGWASLIALVTPFDVDLLNVNLAIPVTGSAADPVCYGVSLRSNPVNF